MGLRCEILIYRIADIWEKVVNATNLSILSQENWIYLRHQLNNILHGGKYYDRIFYKRSKNES